MLDRLTEKLLQQVFAPLVKTGRLEVTTPSGKALIFGDGGQPQARLRFADRRAVIALLRDPDLNFGELFMQQRLLVEQGTVYDVLELVLRGARHVPVSATVRMLDAWRMKLRPLLQNNLRGRSRANVAHHYDLDERLYQLFLDSERQYSCAYFEQGNEDLETAQLAKKRHIAAKLLIEPGQRVLDIGCGGGLVAEPLCRMGASVTGVDAGAENIKHVCYTVMQKDNIVLIGMPGVGKSTVGVILAKVLGYQFIDADLVIQEQEKRLLREIIAEEGTEGFIQVENRVNATLEAHHAIIATGGSVVYGKEAMEHLQEIGTVIYLEVAYPELEKRLEDIKGRGVVLRDGQTLYDLYLERTPLYEKYADIRISETGLDIEQTVEQIVDGITNLH